MWRHTYGEMINFVNSYAEYSFLFSLVQKVYKSTKKSQSYNQKQSGTFFMAHGVVLLDLLLLHLPLSTVMILHYRWWFQVAFNRSSMVRVEAHVSINCSITSATTYIWRLFNATTHRPLSLDDFNLTQHVFHDPMLFIPPRSLPYGRYIVELRVCL